MSVINDFSDCILAVGLNPSWQKTLEFENLQFYEVNRARSVKLMASGKGINFARAAENWGKQKAAVFQFAGGDTGEKICRYLDAEPISHCSVKVKQATRVCTTCLCLKTEKMTELIEPSGEISSEKSEQLLSKIKANIPTSKGVAICGTYPSGITENFYLEIAQAAKEAAKPIIMDSWMNVEPTLQFGVDILKINLEEISALTGEAMHAGAIKKCLQKYPVKIAAVTAGPDNAYLATEDKLWIYSLPRLPKVINPIGAGDTVSSVFFSEYLNGTDPHEAFACGLAAASASCLTSASAKFEKEEALKIRQNINIRSENI
jgi:1-phosphofructokinase family hexose kinase